MLAVVLALNIALDGEHNTLNVLNATTEREKGLAGSLLVRLVARITSIGTGDLGHQFGMAFVQLTGQTLELAEQGRNLVVHCLHAVVKIGKLVYLVQDSAGVGIGKSFGSTRELVQFFKMLALGLDVRFLTGDGICGGCGKLVELKRIGVLRSSGGDTEEVARRKVDLLAVEAGCTVDIDTETMSTVLDAQLAGATQIAVGIVTVTKGQTVNVVVILEVGGAVVEETANRASARAVLVDDKSKTVELANGVYTALADSRTASVDEPEVQVTTATLLTRSTELGLNNPFRLGDGVIGEDGTPCAAGSGRSEDDAVG